MPSFIDSVPAVIGFNPNPGTTFIPPRPVLLLEFSVPMLVGTFDSDEALNVGASLYTQDDTAVPLTFVSYDPLNKVLKSTPTTDLTPGQKYKIIIHSRPDGFLSTGGRPLLRSTFYEFTVNDFSLPVPSLVGPGNGVIVPDQISITVYCPQVSGTNVLITQLSTDKSFTSVDWVGALPATGSSNHVFDVSASLLTDMTYYFRSRLLDATSGFGGAWSDTWNLYYGTREFVYPESRRQVEDAPFAEVKSIGFEDGTYNLTEWPSISITFTNDIPTGSTNFFEIKKLPVDGGMPSSVNGAWVITDNVATFTPTESILSNYRYTVKVLPRLKDVLDNELPTSDYYFVGRYTPFYAQPMEVRAILGNLIGDVTDDLIAFFIHKTSMDANWRVRLQPYQLIDPLFIFGGATIPDLQNIRNPALYAIHEWVVLGTAIHLLEQKIYEFVPGADGSLQIADYRESLGSSALLKFINDKVKELRRRQDEYEMQFSRRATRPRSGVRSNRTPFGTQLSLDNGYKPHRSSF